MPEIFCHTFHNTLYCKPSSPCGYGVYLSHHTYGVYLAHTWNFRGGFNFAIFAGPCSIQEIKNCKNFDHTKTSSVTGNQQSEASNNAVVGASMMIGCAAAVYYVHASCKFMLCRIASVRRFTKLKPCENFIFRYLEPIREILSPRKNKRRWYVIPLCA